VSVLPCDVLIGVIMKKIDMTGRRFGRLTVVCEAGANKRGNILWQCLCDHGGKGEPVRVVKNGLKLREGATRSCGCLLHDYASAHGKTFRRHGMYLHPLYQVWRNMKGRCYNQKRKDYGRYGALGTRVCREWMTSDNFFSWALSHGYAPGLTVERKNNNRNYMPSNCYFATRKQQTRNRRNTLMVTWRGECRPLAEWAEIVGIKYAVVFDRIHRGWKAEDALTQKPNRHRKLYLSAGRKGD
jgi:hypothetical protein